MNAHLADCLSEEIDADDPRQRGAALFKKLAVLYLRVSTADQMDTDYDPEGISIPTQRTKGFEKACVLGARVVKVFIEPGISATSTKGRKAFHAMMAYVRAHGNIDYVIVYARSRLHRNAADAAVTKAELKKYNCAIASVLDYTEDNLLGDLVAGILDVINEYQSRAMGQDVAEKMEGKAAAGGLPARAPIGYLNVREKIEFREVRTVIADPQRRDLIVMAFELYATGMYSYKRLQATLTDAGLLTLPTKKFPSGHELSIEKIGTMLADRFYIGKVAWKGKEYHGRHEPLIAQELFDRVQEVRDLQRGGGTRARSTPITSRAACGATGAASASTTCRATPRRGRSTSTSCVPAATRACVTCPISSPKRLSGRWRTTMRPSPYRRTCASGSRMRWPRRSASTTAPTTGCVTR